MAEKIVIVDDEKEIADVVELYLKNEEIQRLIEEADDELWTIGRFHYGECEFLSNFSDNKKFQNEGNRNHNDHFMGSQQKGLTGYTTGIQSYIVYDHSVDHNGSHDNCVNCVFKFSFWHKNILLLIMSYVLFVIIRGMCVSNINNRFISI